MASKLIGKVLVANRGEIACRVFRSAKRLGISSVAVYSDIDKNSVHTQMADYAYHIGASPPRESYLNKHKILEVAQRSDSQAIHPGYGFLSENSEFALMCEKNSIIFIGPPASAIRSMGSKSESKKIMIAAGVPVVPGYQEDNQDVNLLLAEAEKIGYPVLIKAVMGGGGKGMKVAQDSGEFLRQLESAKREARSSFGDDSVILEKYITRPRHIEVQVFADTFGNAVYLFERDCSVQRRHQKVIEEAPSNVSEDMRRIMGRTATQAALAVGYVGAGTVEFIFDETTKEFYFMEMNTRLQVEHPVTEMITGLDLVEWQFRIASGFPLPLKQEDLKIKGHAIESRIYAENPQNSFLPTSGKLAYLATPTTSETVRIDSGVRQGDEISVFYDPLIAKLIVWAPNRSEAISLMNQSLSKYNVCGLPTNITFLKTLVNHPKFQNYEFNTNFIPLNKDQLLFTPEITPKDICIAAACQLMHQDLGIQKSNSPWTTLKSFRLNSSSIEKFSYEEVASIVNVTRAKEGFKVSFGEFESNITVKYLENNVFEVDTGNRKEEVVLVKHEQSYWMINSSGFVYVLTPKDLHLMKDAEGELGSKSIKAPIPGKITKILCKEGDVLKQNSVLIVIESMKMEHMITLPREAKILNIFHKENDFVNAKDVLIELG